MTKSRAAFFQDNVFTARRKSSFTTHLNNSRLRKATIKLESSVNHQASVVVPRDQFRIYSAALSAVVERVAGHGKEREDVKKKGK